MTEHRRRLMALPASAITTAGGRIIVLFKSLSFQHHRPVLGNVLVRPISAASNSLKSTRMQLLNHQPPNDPPKFKMLVDYATKKLHEVIPDSLKKFPWAEAESIVTKQLLTLLHEALKWSLAASFIFGSMSDIIYTISRNQELLIPLGLFCGCVVAEFLKETYREYLQYSQGRGKTWHLLGMGCFFVLMRIIVICCSAEPQAFLLHAANGGLMHALWQWKISSNPEGDDDDDSGANVTLEDASIFRCVEN